MLPLVIARLAAIGILSMAVGTMKSPAVAQVSIMQMPVSGPRGTATASPQTIQESDYILGGQAGNQLLNPNGFLPQYPATNSARSIQIGANNTSNIDTIGAGNGALNTVIGSQNVVNQQQYGINNQSKISVYGDSNNVGSRQQDVSGALTTITVRGDYNNVSAEQFRNGSPISITQTGNGGNVSVSRR